MPELSIVIPTLGRSGTLEAVIQGLACQPPPLETAELLVVVDANAEDVPPPGSAGLSFALKLLRAERPGASAARNVGWRTAQAPLILFLDDDIVPSPQLVAEHLGSHATQPEVEAGVLGLVRWSPRVKVTPFMRWLERGIQFDYDRITGTSVGWQLFYSCNVSVKREMLERVGGFDEERFPFGYEDMDLARRMSDHGFRLLFNPAAVGEHLKTETIDSWRRKLERIAVSERRFVETYPSERPYFYERFRAASEAPPARGRSGRLARYVGPEVPWLGPFVWRSFDLVCSQELAPDYLSAWNAAETKQEV